MGSAGVFSVSVRITDAMAAAIRERGEMVAAAVRQAIAEWAKRNGVRLDAVPQMRASAFKPARPGVTHAWMPPEWRIPLERAVLARGTAMATLAGVALCEMLGIEAPEQQPSTAGWRANFAMSASVADQVNLCGGVSAVVRPALREWAATVGVDLPAEPERTQQQVGPRPHSSRDTRSRAAVLPMSWKAPLLTWCAENNTAIGTLLRAVVARYVGAEMPAAGWSRVGRPHRERAAKPERKQTYAPCPVCGGAAMERERRLDEWDATCEQGHHWWQDIPGVRSYSHQWAGDDEGTEDAA